MVANLAVQAFLSAQLPGLKRHLRQILELNAVDAELEDWIWQTLSAWHQQGISSHSQLAPQEPMFWHCLFCLHDCQQFNPALKDELQGCLDFFDGKIAQPDWCVGFRPLDELEDFCG